MRAISAPGAGRILAVAAGASLAYMTVRVAIGARRAELRNEQVRQALELSAAQVRARLDAWELLHPAGPAPRRRPGWTVFPWEYGYSEAAEDLIRARRYPAGPAELEELPEPP